MTTYHRVCQCGQVTSDPRYGNCDQCARKVFAALLDGDAPARSKASTSPARDARWREQLQPGTVPARSADELIAKLGWAVQS